MKIARKRNAVGLHDKGPTLVAKVRKPKKHPTKKLTMKTALIDKGMIPVIKWLNSFSSVVTKWCCQGSDDPRNNPYVVFACDEPMELLTIVNKVNYDGVVEIRPPYNIRMIDYCIRFPTKANFETFKERLKWKS